MKTNLPIFQNGGGYLQLQLHSQVDRRKLTFVHRGD